MNTRLTIVAFLSFCYTLSTFAAGWVTPTPLIKCELLNEQDVVVWSKEYSVNLYRAGTTAVSDSSPDELVSIDLKIEVLDKRFGTKDTYRMTEMKLSAGNMTTRKENYGAGVKVLAQSLYEKLSLESADGSLKYQLNCFSR